jgi:signal transduction histidine kinase
MTDPLLNAAARRHVNRLLKAVAEHAATLDRRFQTILRKEGHDSVRVRAFLAITPAAASQLASFPQFLEQVEYNGRRLAKLNVRPNEANAALKSFGALLDQLLPGQFEPAREQLYLATVLALKDAFYQVREVEAQAFFGIYRVEAEARDLDDLLGRFVRILTHTFRAHAGRLHLLEQPLAPGLSRPLYIERGEKNEALIADPAMRGRFASYWSFPMAPTALLQFGFVSPYPWLPREATLLHAVIDRCREAIEKAKLQGEVRRLEVEARTAEEEERRRIGRELHDEAGQSLVFLRLRLEMIEQRSGPELSPLIAEARGITERTIDELRRIVAALSPAVLERLGLTAALRQLTARFRKAHPAAVRVSISGSLPEFPRQIQEVIYRVAQESLQNIAKHSQATRVNLLLQSTDSKVRLSVSDNGAGFASDAALSKPMSFGLAGMRERAALLQGSLAVRSAPGKGVRVVLELPHNSLR